MKSAIGDSDILNKKVPESKKYTHVASSIDTGASAKKVTVISAAELAKRRAEIFKRIRPSTLVRMLGEREVNESIYAMGTPSVAGDGNSVASVVAKANPKASHLPPASIASVTSVAGSILSVCESDVTIAEARDLILIDLREPDEFEKCRLPLATNYPAAKINRDQFSPELYKCKRDATKLLVVYHTNEQLTTSVAALLVQKGWEKVYALTGGFDDMVQNYPEILEGQVPDRPDTAASRPGAKAKARS